MEWTRRRIVLVVAAVVLSIAGIWIGLYLTEYDADSDAVAAVKADDGVTVNDTGDGYVVHGDPITANTTGLVLYPGARVEARSYVPTAAEIVRRSDVAVVVPEMPLRLAILDTDRAAGVRDRFPSVSRWYVGGHSLGGAMACRYAAGNRDAVDGIVLLAAYCDRNVSRSDLQVLSVQGSADDIIDRDAERTGQSLLPPDARRVVLDGVTHAQFGAYGPQAGDGTPTRPDEAARRLIGCTIVRWLDESGAANRSTTPPQTYRDAATRHCDRDAARLRRGGTVPRKNIVVRHEWDER